MRPACGMVMIVVVALAACERRPEEPSAGPPVTYPSDVPKQTSESPVDGGGRCIVHTSKQPAPSAAPAASCPPDPMFAPPELPKATLVFPEAASSPELVVELAATERTRERGLMYRTHMPEDHGMLFRFGGSPRVHSFWMRNTCISLDMLFINEDGLIAGILENVPTLNDSSRSIPCAVTYVLETNAGWTRRHGVKAGQRVELPSDEAYMR